MATNSQRPNNYVYFCVACASLNSVLLGYDIGVAGGAMFIARDVLTLSDVQVEIILASLNLAAIPGAVLARPVSDNLGRTKTLALASSLFIAGSSVMAFASNFWILLLGRIVLGLAVGTGLSIDPLYISEIAPPSHRGSLVSWSEGAINVGILFGFITTFALAGLDPKISWRVMLGLGGVFPLVMLILSTCCMPETPRFLAKIGNTEEAERVLKRLCSTAQEVERILDDLREDQIRRSGLEDVTFRQLLWHEDTTIRYMVTTVLCVAVAQQLSGVEAFMYYSPFLFKQVGFQTRSEILGLTAMMGFAKTVTLVFVACLLDTKGAGRRRMLFWSYVGMAISLFFLAWGSFSSLRGVVVVSIFCYVVMFSVGAGPITWLFSAEIMPTNVRARGMVLATTMNRFAGATIGMTFLSASNASASGALLSFALVCTTCAFFCYVYCPETQGKTLEEMYAAFSKMSGVGMSGRAGAGGRRAPSPTCVAR